MTLNSFDYKKARVYLLTTRFLYGTDKELRARSKTDSEDLAFFMPELIKGDIDSPHVDHPLIKDHPGEMSEQIDIYLAHLIKRALSARPEWIHSDGTLKEALLKGYERMVQTPLRLNHERKSSLELLKECGRGDMVAVIERFLLDARAQPVKKRSSSIRL